VGLKDYGGLSVGILWDIKDESYMVSKKIEDKEGMSFTAYDTGMAIAA